MVSLMALWLPILIASVLVFIASNILWMLLPFHRSDYKTLPDDKALIAAIGSAPSGQYLFPYVDWKTVTPEQKDALQQQAGGLLLLRNPNRFNFGPKLFQYFLFIVVIEIIVAYITGRTRPAGTHYLEVFRIAGAAALLGFGFSSVPDSIWYGKPWSNTFKQLVDALVYALLTAGVFGWLWPR